MILYIGDFWGDETIIVPFNSFDSSGGSITITGLAAADIEIYKDGIATTRASDNGYTVVADFDSSAGLHIITVDLGDDSDGGFFAAGSEYSLAINAITIDGQTVRFWAASFSIRNRALSRVVGEPGGKFSWATATIVDILGWMGALSRNRREQTETEQSLINDAQDGSISTAAVSDDGTTFVRDEWS